MSEIQPPEVQPQETGNVASPAGPSGHAKRGRRNFKSRTQGNWRHRTADDVKTIHPDREMNNRQKGWNRWVQEANQSIFQEANATYVQDAWKATDEGRRLYLGNIDWQIKPADVALWIEGAGYNL
ncbi:hypothetical protein TWF694_002144 [Orbilia ellipsospora]|uniref:Uncharacterized protein n=1 Tax=Orbilia ellipsospora TaxID=2528407 RepID=A0AAV9X7L0_9PEZI